MTTTSHRTLTTEAEIAAYLHRSRMAILQVLTVGPATASQIAAQLGVHPANLTRHIRILKDAGLIFLKEKRDTGRNLEKYYQVVALSFDVAPEVDQLEAPHKLALAFARSDLSAALAHLPDRETGPVLAVVAGARIAPHDIERFGRAIQELVESFEAADNEAGETYHLTMGLYPASADVERKEIRLTAGGVSR